MSKILIDALVFQYIDNVEIEVTIIDEYGSVAMFDKNQAIQLRDFLNEFIGENNATRKDIQA